MVLPGHANLISLLTELRRHVHAMRDLKLRGVVPPEDSLVMVTLVLTEQRSSKSRGARRLMFEILMRAMQISN